MFHWTKLYRNVVQRAALAETVVRDVVVEQGLQHVFLEGGKEEEDKGADAQDMNDENGFDRNATFPNKTSVLSRRPVTCIGDNTTLPLPPTSTCTSTNSDPDFTPESTRDRISVTFYGFFTRAGMLFLAMQLSPKSVYYLVSTFKVMEYNDREMKYFTVNKSGLLLTNPWVGLGDWPERCPEEETRRPQGNQALVKIVLMLGTVYRKRGKKIARGSAGEAGHERTHICGG
ncbi:hypothetical protein GQ43DRAFT_475115 [Delitschia confertaspora ATCC 74209]|uniref:Uncharacterized protein n=1 Tax=Delitschia confertaspora ATCC 74209 TaxID=1513339 RepID=A0A9P4JEB1_9PLEO|nr:hypothetical protein GQ43DRAFT_475115 [Delitschia confertaspora ATCC 74209]